MDTKNFVDLIKKFGNDNKQPDTTHNKIPSYLNEIYPYGQFPSHYTKNGQKDWQSSVNSQNQDNQYIKQPAQFNSQNYGQSNHNIHNNTQTQSHVTTQNQDQSQSQNFGGHNHSQGIFEGMDLKTLLPLMMNLQNKDKFNTNDIFGLLMPTLAGDNPNMKELMKIFTQNKSKPKETDKKITPSKMNSIDSYIKV